jgi:hypothetical protein
MIHIFPVVIHRDSVLRKIFWGEYSLRYVTTYSVPFGHHALFLESGKLPAVVDGGEHLPHQDEGEADGHDGADHAEDDAWKESEALKAESIIATNS